MADTNKNTLCIDDKHRLLLSRRIAKAMGHTGDAMSMVAILVSLAITDYIKITEDAEL